MLAVVVLFALRLVVNWMLDGRNVEDKLKKANGAKTMIVSKGSTWNRFWMCMERDRANCGESRIKRA